VIRGLRSVIIVGASLAGISTARALRGAGFDGRLTVIGAEPHPPYDRPPLSKDLLGGRATVADLALLGDDDLRLDLRLGLRVTELIPSARGVRTDDGRLVESDAVVVATGARPHRLPLPTPAGGVHVLRTLDDAVTLRTALAGGGQLVIVGGGFIGCEVAATARGLGLDVTLVEAGPLPLSGAVGPQVAARLLRLHREQGVRVECGAGVAEVAGTDTVTGVRLADGRLLPADILLIAIGAAPETGWLRGSGVALAPDGGVRCDASCRTSIPAVFAAGDLASAEHALLGGPARIEHWTNAMEQGGIVAAALLDKHHAANGSRPPYFWSDQWSGRLQVAGRPGTEDAFRLVDGDLDGDLGDRGGFAGVFERPGAAGPTVTAVVAFNRPRVFGRIRRGLGAEIAA
jgi:3-phenylpropionate/trans-cinnamate dioxygenase ferredoxin reductase subunit